MATTHLTVGQINLSKLREYYRVNLRRCLECCEGTKAIVWDDNLIGPIDLIAENSLLKECGVIKMWQLQPPLPLESHIRNVIFIVRPIVSLMQMIASSISKNTSFNPFNNNDVQFHLFFVPNRSELCIRKLKELSAFELLTNVDDFSLRLLPLDYDLLSLDYNTCFSDCTLNNDYRSLYQVAKSIMTMQELYGVIPNIYGQGPYAAIVWDILKKMTREYGMNDNGNCQIDNLLIIDRSIDLLTPLLSQLTYEGLIDENLTITNTVLRLPKEDGNTEKIILNSSDKLFSNLRDRNFNSVGSFLSKEAKILTTQTNERLAAKTVQDIQQFVSKLPHLQTAKASLSLHTNIAHIIHESVHAHDFLESLRVQQEFYKAQHGDKASDIIDKYITRRVCLNKVLRLICIQSYCSNGLKPKVLEQYKRDIIHAYGFENVLTLQNLETAGLLRAQNPANLLTYSKLRKTLKLTVEDVNEQKPSDIAYTFSGYAPLTIRLAQFLQRPGWRSIQDILSMLPGPNIQEVQMSPSQVSFSSNQPKSTLVFFVGGVTYAEISALRFLSQMEDSPTEYIVATTSIINGDNFLKTLCHTLTPIPRGLNPFE